MNARTISHGVVERKNCRLLTPGIYSLYPGEPAHPCKTAFRDGEDGILILIVKTSHSFFPG